MIPPFPERKKRGPAIYVLFAVPLILIAFSAIFFFSDKTEDTGLEELIDCEINRGPCTRNVGRTGMTAALDIEPKPVSPMTRLLFRIDLKRNGLPVTDRDIALNLSMPGMYMAQNRVKLVHRGEGRYEGEGTIVRCPSGKKIWKAEVLLERPAAGEGGPPSAAYLFRVEN